MATLLMNPRKRRKNPASKAQLRARAAFVRNYGGGKKRASNPRKRRRSNPAAIPATMMSPIVMRARPRKSAIVMSNPDRKSVV